MEIHILDAIGAALLVIPALISTIIQRLRGNLSYRELALTGMIIVIFLDTLMVKA